MNYEPHVMNPNELLEKDVPSGPESWEYDHHCILSAISYRNDPDRCYSGPKDWDKDYMQHRGEDPLMPGANLIVVNETLSAVETYLAFLLYQNPFFKINPRHPEDVISALIKEEQANYNWREYNVQKPLAMAGFDSAITGKGYIAIGWTPASALQGKSPKTGRMSTRDYIRPDAPWARRVSPYDMLQDPEAPDYDFESSIWVGELYWQPLYEIYNSADRLLDPTGKLIEQLKKGYGRGSWSADYSNSYYKKTDRKNEYKTYQDKVQVCRFWNKRHMSYKEYICGILEPLREGPWYYLDENQAPYLDGFPYVELPFYYLPDQCTGLGIPRVIRNQQHELNRSRTQMFDYRQRITTIIYTVIQEAFVDKDGPEKWANAKMAEAIFVKMHDAIKAIDIPALPQDIWTIEAKIMDDIRRILGLDEIARGGAIPSRTSANEIEKRTNFLSLKTRPRKMNFDDAAKKVIRQMLQHEARWASQERVMKVAGRVGQYWDQLKAMKPDMFIEDAAENKYVKFGKSDIQAEFEVEVQSMAMGDYDPDLRRAALQKLLDSAPNVGPIMAQMGDGRVPNYSELYEMILEAWEIKDAGRFFVMTPATPMEMEPKEPQPQNGQTEPLNPEGQMEAQSVNPASGLLGALMGGQA